MTEDYTVKQRPSATPYVIGGAGLGAGAGLLVNKWAAKPMSHEDIVNEMNDKDKFEANVKEGAENKASWELVKQKQDELKAAETELEEAKKGTMPADLKESKELAEAQQKFDKAQKAVDDAIAQASGRKTSRTVTKSAGYITPEEFMKLDGVIVNQAQEYAKKYADYNKAVVSATNNAKGTKNINTFINKFDDEATKIMNNARSNKKQKTETIEKELKTYVDSLYPDYNDSQLKNLAKEEGKDWDKMNKNARNAYKNTKNNEMKAKRTSALKEILGEQVDITYKNTNGKYIKSTSFANIEEFKNLVDEYDKKLSEFPDNLETVEHYRKEIAKLTEERRQGSTTQARVKQINKDIQTAKNNMNKASEIEQLVNTYNEKADSFFNKFSYIQEQKQAIEEAVKTDSNVKSAKKDLGNVANKAGVGAKFKIPAETTTVVEEAVTKTEADIDNKLVEARNEAKTALETAKEKANNVTAERKVDENAVKTAEEKVKNAKEAFETETKNLAEKLGKKPLMNKWLAMGIGAAALTLGALAVRPKAKEV